MIPPPQIFCSFRAIQNKKLRGKKGIWENKKQQTITLTKKIIKPIGRHKIRTKYTMIIDERTQYLKDSKSTQNNSEKKSGMMFWGMW